MDPEQLYKAYVTAILVVFVTLGLLGFAKPHRASGYSNPTIQMGGVVRGTTPVDVFNPDVQLDTTQVERR